VSGYSTVRTWASVKRSAALTIAMILALALGFAVTANGASFSWYGEGNSTCWQAGGTPSADCDGVGATFLNSSNPPRMNQGAAAKDIEFPYGSGDYCNYERLGDALIYTDENPESAWTGFAPPTPYGNWQEGDAHENVCQADGAAWGQEIRGAANTDCTGQYASCSMEHYASFASQGLEDRPWSSAFQEPSLLVSSEADPQSASVSVGAWGFVCPLLEQAGTNKVIEYCLEAWKIGSGFPNISEFDVASECFNTTNYNAGMVITDFAPGTRFATEASGSASTFTFANNPANRTFAAYITQADLMNAINAINGKCHGGLSTTAAEYALIGVQDGVEGGGLSLLGGHTANLQLRTEFTPEAPVATTESATASGETEATLNGTVNAHGGSTSYYYQYGLTQSYGSTTPVRPVGDLIHQTPESERVTGLAANALYHFRLVATNSAGTSYGADRVFTTADSRSAQWAFRDPTNGNQAVFFRGNDGTLWSDVYEQSTGVWTATSKGAKMAANTSPTALRDPTNGNQVAFFQGKDKTLWSDVYEQSTGVWTAVSKGAEVAPGTSPTALRDPTNGNQVVFFQGKDKTLWSDVYEQSTGVWTATSRGAQMAAKTSPTALRDPTNGNQVVFFQGKDGTLWSDVYEQSTGVWTAVSKGSEVAPGTSPTAFRDPTNGNQAVFFQGEDGALWSDVYEQSTGVWTATSKGAKMGVETSPTALRDPTNGNQAVFFEGADGALWSDVYEQSNGTWTATSKGAKMG
jgi:hypothetical protein